MSAPPVRGTDSFDVHMLTVLAWRRTALRMGLLSIAGAQLLALAYGPLAYLLGLAGVAVALVLHLSVSLQSLRVARAVREGSRRPSLARASVRVGVLTAFAVAVAASVLAWMAVEAFWVG